MLSRTLPYVVHYYFPCSVQKLLTVSCFLTVVLSRTCTCTQLLHVHFFQRLPLTTTVALTCWVTALRLRARKPIMPRVKLSYNCRILDCAICSVIKIPKSVQIPFLTRNSIFLAWVQEIKGGTCLYEQYVICNNFLSASCVLSFFTQEICYRRHEMLLLGIYLVRVYVSWPEAQFLMNFW